MGVKDLTVILKNKPGMLADMGEILGQNNINMEGICGFPLQDEGIIHILVEDDTTTKWVLEAAGFEVRAVREVLVMDVGNIAGKPGTGGKIARKIGNAGVNIDLIYFAEHNKLVLGVDNMERAKSALDL
ncbi:MAG: amino acid-binding protein [Candidatus Thorarchaeota archaeon]